MQQVQDDPVSVKKVQAEVLEVSDEYDEAAAAREFQEALMEWRKYATVESKPEVFPVSTSAAACEDLHPKQVQIPVAKSSLSYFDRLMLQKARETSTE